MITLKKEAKAITFHFLSKRESFFSGIQEFKVACIRSKKVTNEKSLSTRSV